MPHSIFHFRWISPRRFKGFRCHNADRSAAARYALEQVFIIGTSPARSCDPPNGPGAGADFRAWRGFQARGGAMAQGLGTGAALMWPSDAFSFSAPQT